MAKKIAIARPRSSAYRMNRPLLRHPQQSSCVGGGRIAEVAGGTTAEFAAVACCCPATVVNLIVLAVYKIPTGICRKAVKEHKRRRLVRKGMLPLNSSASMGSWDEAVFMSAVDDDEFTLVVVEANEMDEDFMELENEMWQRFDNGGFWRSLSQREA